MTPEKLLEAFTDLEDMDIMNAKKQKTRHAAPGRRFAVLIAAVIAMMAITVTAFAAEEISGWFAKFFENNTEAPLSTGQLDFIEENEQIIGETQTQNGYTLELKSAITDGKIAYILLGITAPEDMPLNRTEIPGYSKKPPVMHFGNDVSDLLQTEDGEPIALATFTYTIQEDNDGLDNTQDILITAIPAVPGEAETALNSGSVWKLHIDDLIAEYCNDSFRKEMEKKYNGFAHEKLTDEELAKVYPKEVLTEEEWTFAVSFDSSDFRETELIEAPITLNICVGMRPEDGRDVYMDMKITSFVLRSLSASIYCEDKSFAPEIGNNFDRPIYVVMEDGQRIRLKADTGLPGEQKLVAEAPILLDEVSHVLLPGGIKLPMP